MGFSTNIVLDDAEIHMLRELIRRTLLDKSSLPLVRNDAFRRMAHKVSQIPRYLRLPEPCEKM